jgi:DNA-binding NarL/FixJ family response regulator
MTRVFLVAESNRARERLAEVLESADLEVAGVAPDLHEIGDGDLTGVDVMLAQTSDETPGEVLQSVEDSGALDLTRVALLMDEAAPSWVVQALRAGVRGILPAAVDGNQLSAAIRAIAQGLVVLYPNEERTARRSSAEAYAVEALTPREEEVLQMLSQGKSNKEIAARLKISDHTAKFHVASVLGKLGAATRAEAVSIAMRRGLILL